MRPAGEVRQALSSAASNLVAHRGCFTGRDAAAWAKVGLEKARRTLSDMARAGDLVVVGQERMPGVCRPVNLYSFPALPAAGGADLAAVVRCWAEFR